MKNLLNSVMLFLLLFIGQNAWGQEVLASGDLTSTITWSVEQTGTDSYTLNIMGYGDMPDYSGLKDMPWAKCQSAYGVTTNYNSMITELNIDSRITKIGRRTFVKAESITSVTIPANCVSIGQEAFKYCSNLKEIYIPSSVTSIGTDAFSNCRSLALIHYDGRCDANTGIAFSNVAASGKIIEKSGTGTSYANVPEGWEYYTHGEQCTRKAWVAENASGDKLFIYGQNPGARVNYAASGAVYNTDSPEYHPWRVNCWKYKSLEINRNVSVIESNELCGYSDNGVGKEGFASLETITVESGNESFVVGEDGALYNAAMTSIRLYPVTNTATHIDIPSTITSIGSGAFYATKNLESVTFHANSLYFGQYSFARTSLNFIYFDTSQASLSWSATSFTGVAEEGVVAANGETNAFKNFTSMIGSGWTFDGDSYGPVRTYISDDILYVVGNGEYTTKSSKASWYSQRSSIKKIIVKEGITNIGGEAFANCSNVTEVTLNNTGSIKYYAFRDCSELVRVNIGSGVTEFNPYYDYIVWYPFSGCSKLSTINVTDLAKYCSLTGIEWLASGTAEEKTLLINGVAHSSTSELVIPEGVDSYNAAFRYFSNVTKIKLPSSLKTIADNSFYGHTYLTEITIPSTVSSVGKSAFGGCTNLKRIVCLAPTCPSASGSIATNPENITLKVPSGTASQYKTDSYWKDFKIEECRYEVEDIDIYKYGTLTSNGYVIASLYSDYKVKSWSSTDTDIATAIYDTQYAARVYAKDYVYDGTTAKPYKEFAIRADLGDYDSCVWNIKLYPREVELIDGNAYKNTEDFSINGKISYTRTYTEKYKNHLQCFYVPFDVEVTDELLEGYTFYELYMVSQDDENGNGEIEDDEPLMMYLNRVPAGRTLYANMPYYIKAKEVSTLTVIAENATLHAATNGSVSCSTTKNEYTLTGINESTNVKGLYTMSAKGNFSHYTKDTYIGSFRWYMSIRDRRAKGAEYENYARPIQIVIDGEEETTGIANLDDKASAPQNDKVFTLDGRQVNNTDNLPSGIYIVNGKKVFKK